MIGLFLASLEAFFEEVSSSLGKKSIAKKEESPYAYLFITYFIGAFVFLVVGISTSLPFVFDFASLPTFFLKIVLEIFLSYVAVSSLSLFNRSFFSLSRMMTIPFVLLIDFFLGTNISLYQASIVIVMFFIFIMLCLHNKIGIKQLYLALPLAFLPALTIILFKYNITHYNTVFSEQFIGLCIVALWAFIMDFLLTKENPLRFLTHPIILTQAISSGLASLAGSFAYQYGSATVITAIRRTASLLFSLLSDLFFFRRKVSVVTYAAIIILLILLYLLSFPLFV